MDMQQAATLVRAKIENQLKVKVKVNGSQHLQNKTNNILIRFNWENCSLCLIWKKCNFPFLQVVSIYDNFSNSK